MVAALAFFGFLYGAATGSFLAVVVERVPMKKSLWDNSVCVCGTPIPMYRNIPIFSFLRQKGRARCCNARIPSWYMHCELLCAVVGAVCFVVPVHPSFKVAAAVLAWAAVALYYKRTNSTSANSDSN